MSSSDPLANAAAAYASAKWDKAEWAEFVRETGMHDIINRFPRLYRSLDWQDEDYPDVALATFRAILREGLGPDRNEQKRMDLLVDAMPDLPEWVQNHAPARTQRLFTEYLRNRQPAEIPSRWQQSQGNDKAADKKLTFMRVDKSGQIAKPKTQRKPVDMSITIDGEHVESGSEVSNSKQTQDGKPTIFIVHGHDEAALNAVRVFVSQKTGVLPISLAEQPGRGNTIIEKFERHGVRADYVIVLLTPDDVGTTAVAAEAAEPMQRRARQNVVLELGYFIGSLGRDKVVVIDAGVERPSDLAGLSYVAYPGDWKINLLTELQDAGLVS